MNNVPVLVYVSVLVIGSNISWAFMFKKIYFDVILFRDDDYKFSIFVWLFNLCGIISIIPFLVK